MSHFQRLQISGKDASQFLQGQLTINVNRLTQAFMPCAICNLKGRVQFGLWVRLDDDSYEMVVASDLAQALIAHLKKYGAFSKIAISEPIDIFPTVIDGLLSFTDRADSACDWLAWMTTSIETGNAWITALTSERFQPQELRLHQRGGVDYDKGCYIGQEVVARIYFKAKPRGYLHRVILNTGLGQNIQAGDKLDKVEVVNVAEIDAALHALVIGAPEEVAKVGKILPLPDGMNGDVARVTG